MNPLVLFAGTLLPELLKLVAGKNGDEIASTVEKVVTSVTGATTPEEAKAKIAADPKVDTELQLKLAQVALDAHKLDVEAQAKADADADQLAMQSTSGARSALMQMLATPETLWIATTPTVISYMVVTGFLALIGALLIFGHSDKDFTKDQTVLQILNICIGAIAAGFATVLNFWLGSSLGSRRKDQTSATIDKVREITQTPPGGGDTGNKTGGGGGDGPTGKDGAKPADGGKPKDTTPVEPKKADLPIALAGVGHSTNPQTMNTRQDVAGPPPCASFRYNNPGAQWPSSDAARFGQLGYGLLHDGNKIAHFPSPVNGAAANFDLLNHKYVGMQIGAAGKMWTGSHGFGVPGYPADQTLTRDMIADPKLAIAFLKAIAGRESGSGDNLTEAQWNHAHAMFQAGSADKYLATFNDSKLLVKPETKPIGDPPPAGKLETLIIAAMNRKGYKVTRNEDERNIVYIEGMSMDGSPNNNEANKFNDLRCVIGFKDGEPVMLGMWQATTEPGSYYDTQHPINPGGAARIEFGQYEAWRVGMHHQTQEALVQRGSVTVCRDLNRDMERKGDARDTGDSFGINQHGGYDMPADNIGKASAGCLVGRTMAGHAEFMKIVKQDARYLANKNYMFLTAIFPAADIVA